MIMMTIFYPNTPGGTFDMEYYRSTHLPMIQERCDGACVKVSAERGLGGMEKGSPPQFFVMGHLYFDSIDSMAAKFGPHIPEAIADIPNFTNITPSVQISEVEV